jgi:hypothetical protein
MVNQNEKHPDSELIDDLGGTTEAAKFFKVSAPSISEWRRTGLPKARMMYLQLARPDLFKKNKSPTLPYAIPNGAKAREAKDRMGRQLPKVPE